MVVVENFKVSREEKDIPAKDIAELLNIDKSTMSCYENGHNNFPIDKLLKYAGNYKISLDYLFGISSDADLTTKLTTDKDIIAHNLRRLRDLNGVTQAQIANRLGKSQSFYSRYECGKYYPTTELIYTLIELYKPFSIDKDIFKEEKKHKK